MTNSLTVPRGIAFSNGPFQDDLSLFHRRLESIFSAELTKRCGGVADLWRIGYGEIRVGMTLHNGRVTVAEFHIGSKSQPEK